MHKKLVYKVSIITIIINCVLSLIKLIAGTVSNSKAIISDGIHSLSDVITIVIVMIGIRLSSHKSDKKHPYGHERIESIVAIILSFVLFLIGAGIGLDGIEQITSKSYNEVVIVGNMAIFAAIISIISKEWLFWYTRSVAKRIKSGSLMAEAWHHRTDVMASIGSLIGVIFAKMGYPIVDAIASIVISLFILKASINIFIDSANGLIDRACSDDILNKVREIILNNKNVLSIDNIKSRVFASKIYLDIELEMDNNTSLEIVNNISNNLNNDIKNNIEEVKNCMIRINPIINGESIDT